MHPIALVESFGDAEKWCEPLEYPQRTYYNSNRMIRPRNGAFGWVRNDGTKTHTGLDLFADIATPCRACLNGEIVKFAIEGGYGKTLVLKVKGSDLRAARNNSQLEFLDVGEIEMSDNFDMDAEYFYLRYL